MNRFKVQIRFKQGSVNPERFMGSRAYMYALNREPNPKQTIANR